MPEVGAASSRCRALDGGADGLVAYRAIIRATACAVGAGRARRSWNSVIGQGEAGRGGWHETAGFRRVDARRDLSGGIERALILRDR